MALIKELIETKVRPSVQDDGGDIFYEDFNEETGDEVVHTLLNTLYIYTTFSFIYHLLGLLFNPIFLAAGMVTVRLAGSCVSCPSSSVTLRNGVENMLTHYIPEVKGLIEASSLEEGGDSDSKLEFHPEPVSA